jgi:hypothetical protein
MDPLLKKMNFAAARDIAVIGAPAGFVVSDRLHAAGKAFSESLEGKYSWLVVCVMNRAEVATEIPKVLAALAADGLMWICYPKKTGKLKTDLSRDHGWDAIMGIGLRHMNLISIDDNWTAWGVEHGSDEVSEKTRLKSEARNELLAQYMDHKTREMRYPPEMETLLDAHPPEKAFFLQLSFTNRKEYLEWIVSAKRPETKQQRLDKLVEYLAAGRKNPAGR